MQYRAGVALLDPAKSHVLIYRSPQPLLWPELPAERESLVDDVVFPTAIDPRADIAGNAYDIYYGMADRVIGTLDVRALSSAGTILQAFGSNLSK